MLPTSFAALATAFLAARGSAACARQVHVQAPTVEPVAQPAANAAREPAAEDSFALLAA
jgi:hypothetical protein